MNDRSGTDSPDEALAALGADDIKIVMPPGMRLSRGIEAGLCGLGVPPAGKNRLREIGKLQMPVPDGSSAGVQVWEARAAVIAVQQELGATVSIITEEHQEHAELELSALQVVDRLQALAGAIGIDSTIENELAETMHTAEELTKLLAQKPPDVPQKSDGWETLVVATGPLDDRDLEVTRPHTLRRS